MGYFIFLFKKWKKKKGQRIKSTIDWKTTSSLFSFEHFLELGYNTINERIKGIYLVLLIHKFALNDTLCFCFKNNTCLYYKIWKSR